MEKQERINKIKIQIEYYLSDENLQKDRFFHDLISKNENGYLNLDFLLNCNNLKRLAVTKEEIIEGVQNSLIVELNEEKTMLRRTGNKPLPQLKLLNTKRKASAEKEENDVSDDETELDNVILKICSLGKTEIKWKAISDEFKTKNPGLHVVYMRFKDGVGHIGLRSKRNQTLSFTDKINVDDQDLTIEKCEGDDLIDFWKEHGKHFEMCVSENNRKKGNKKKNDPKKKKVIDRLNEPVELGGEKYFEISRIKSKTRNILNLTHDGDKISGKDHEFLKDLLSFHKNGEAKLKDLNHFTTGQPGEYKHSRCFFIVKNDNTKEVIYRSKVRIFQFTNALKDSRINMNLYK